MDGQSLQQTNNSVPYESSRNEVKYNDSKQSKEGKQGLAEELEQIVIGAVR